MDLLCHLPFPIVVPQGALHGNRRLYRAGGLIIRDHHGILDAAHNGTLMTGDKWADQIVVALQHLAAAKVTVALEAGSRILNVGEQQRDVATELLLQEIVKFEPLTEELLDPLGIAGDWPGTRVVDGV
jgi:hypothetical protein